MMSKHIPAFIPANFFLTRFPYFLVEYFYNMADQTNASEFIRDFYFQNECFREAITIASSSLKEKADKIGTDRDTAHSLLKYYIRMSSRPTPFGLFSFVSSGHSGEAIKAKIELNDVMKRARPDMEWVQKVIEKICLDEKIFLDLQVQRNPLISMKGGRYHIAYLINKLDQKAVSIRKNALTEIVFSLTKDSIIVRELIEKIIEKLSHLVSEKLESTIKLLLEQQFLWFSLLPSLVSPSPFEEFLKKIPSVYQDSLSKLYENILQYSKSKPGEGEDVLLKLNDEMKKCISGNSYLQVDIASQNSQITLPKSILEEVAEGAELLLHIDTNRNAKMWNFTSLQLMF